MADGDAEADPRDATGPPEALAIVGPTASGKTALSLAVARRLDAEIVSMDSRQVYHGMDIGTAKATPAERRAVPHHGLDLLDPGRRYSAGRFAEEARAWIAAIRRRRRVPLLVGGTGFFLRALTHPLFEEPPMDGRRRERLRRRLQRLPPERRTAWLEALDPESAPALARTGGAQRVLRALEVALLTGRPLGWWHRHSPAAREPLQALVFVLELPRDELYRRIDTRVHAMIDAGLVDEVRALLERGYATDLPGMTATGYAEVAAYLQGEASLEEAVERIQRATRRYARRQLTWFRNQLPPGAAWLDATLPPDELADRIAAAWHDARDRA